MHDCHRGSVAGAVALMGAFSLMQGLPSYFFTIGLPAIMRDSGASLSLIGFTYVVWLPHALKWLWAPFFDRPQLYPFRSRIGWLRALPVLLAGAFALVAVFPPGQNMAPLVMLSLVCAMLTTTMQMVVASWLVDHVDAGARAHANAVGVAAMVLGGMTGGGLILYLGETYSWPFAILSVSAAVLLLSAPAWQGTPTGTGIASTAERAQQSVLSTMSAAWLRVFRKPAFPVMAVVVVCLAGSGGADVLMAPLMIDRGFGATETGWILGTVATGAIVPISLGIGWLIKRFGVVPVLSGLLVAKAAVLGLLAVSTAYPPNLVAVLAALDFCLAGALTVTAWQLYMSFAVGPQSTTDFALVSSLDALIRFVGGIAAGQIGDAWSYSVIFGLSATVAIAGGMFAVLLRGPLQSVEHPQNT